MALDEAGIDRVRNALIRETGGRPLTVQQRRSAMTALTAESLRRNPQDGRTAAVTEAAIVLGRITDRRGRPKLSKAQRQTVKKAAAESFLRARVAAEIRETMNAAQAPAPPPGTGLSPQDGGVPSKGDLAGMSREQLAAIPLGLGGASPFWQSPGTAAAAGSAPEPSRPLHEMSADELQAYSADVLGHYGRAAGYGGPVWQ